MEKLIITKVHIYRIYIYNNTQVVNLLSFYYIVVFSYVKEMSI